MRKNISGGPRTHIVLKREEKGWKDSRHGTALPPWTHADMKWGHQKLTAPKSFTIHDVRDNMGPWDNGQSFLRHCLPETLPQNIPGRIQLHS